MRKFTYFIVFSLLLLLFPIQATATENIERMDGKDRFEVAVNISNKGWPNNTSTDTVIVANYQAFADALAAGPLGYKLNAPILLTHSDKLTSVTKNEIDRLQISKVMIVGGPASVSLNVENQLSSMGMQVIRLGGANRYEVSLNVARSLGATNKAIISYGEVFSDALSIAPYAARNGYPILLTRKDNIPAATKTALSEKGISNIIVTGGEASVSKTVYEQLPGTKTRISGGNRYEVSANIISALNLSAEKAFVATGTKFPDALAGSVLAAKMNAPMLLTKPDTLPTSIKNIIVNKGTASFVILGGVMSVSDSVISSIINTPPLYGKTIMLDAGHGGKQDPGAVNNTFNKTEKSLNMEFVTKLGNELTELGADVLYTRQPGQDNYISLEDRAKIANSENLDLFISIHHDGNVNKSANGISSHYSTYRPAIEIQDAYVKFSDGRTYPFVKEDTPNKLFYYQDGDVTKSIKYDSYAAPIAYDTKSPSLAAVKSQELAPILGNALVTSNIKLQYVRDHNLYVTRWTKAPSILLELGFVTNDSEVKVLMDQNNQQVRARKLAQAIADNLK